MVVEFSMSVYTPAHAHRSLQVVFILLSSHIACRTRKPSSFAERFSVVLPSGTSFIWPQPRPVRFLQPEALAVLTQTTLEIWFYLLPSRARAIFEFSLAPTHVSHSQLLQESTQSLIRGLGCLLCHITVYILGAYQEWNTHKMRNPNDEKHEKNQLPQYSKMDN